MVSTLTLVLAGVLLYTLIAMALRQRGVLPESVKVSGPLTTIHTQRGKAFLDRLARRRRLWRAWSNVGVGISLMLLVGLFFVLLLSAYQNILQPEATPIQNPQDALVIPGVNQFLPLSAAPDIVIGLLVGLVVHEGGHGLLCRVEDIEIDSMGLALFTILPIGAFVEPDEESRREASRGAQTRMFAAGVTNNFVVTVLALGLLFGPVAGSIAVVDGVPVGGTLPDSPAAAAGLESGDVLTAVNGTAVDDESELRSLLEATDNRRLVLTTRDGEQLTVERSLLVTRALEQGPLQVSAGQTITAVNGTAVSTDRQLRDALADRTVATLSLGTGGNATTTGPIGAYGAAVDDAGPLNDSGGAPAGAEIVITRVGDERIVDGGDLTEVLARTDPGTEVVVEASVSTDGEGYERETYTVTLGTNRRTGGALIGILGGAGGITGIEVSDFGIQAYPAGQFLDIVSADGALDAVDRGSLAQLLLTILVLPFASVAVPSAGNNFAGFLDPIANFYVTTGPLSVLGDGVVFFLANVLFWTGWVNFNLGLFNCIPAFPLDGGHILRTSTEAILARTPLNSRSHVRAVTISIGLIMGISLLVMLFGPQLLS